jgi:hypothetical protein
MNAPRFSYVKYDADIMFEQAQLRKSAEEFEALVEKHLPDGRAKSLVMTKLEEAYAWAGKGLRDKQVARNGEVAEQPARGNE